MHRSPSSCPPVSSLVLTNFRLFVSLKAEALPWVTVIMGANGTGKTSFLWGLIVALRSFNLRVNSSTRKDSSEVIIDRDDFAVLINCPNYKTASFKSIAHNTNKDESARIDAIIQEQKISWSIKGNGKIKLLSDSPQLQKSKVRFAFVSESMFIPHTGIGEPAIGEILTSGAQNSRGRYGALTTQSKEKIESHLQQLLFIKSITMEDRGIFITDDFGPTEIMFTGEALRKVFTTLVLFYTLAETPEESRVFLLEEPEAHLYPTLQESFIRLLTSLAEDHTVQLFITTNSQHIQACLNVDDVIVLQRNPETGMTATRLVSADDPLLATAIRLPLLALHPAQPLILTEGDQDQPFIRKMAELCSINLQGIQFFTGAKFKDASHMKPLIESICRLHPGVRIRLIRDRDFTLQSGEELSKRDEQEFLAKGHKVVEVIYWDLPTIESYLFLNWCQCTTDPFNFLRQNSAKFMAKFLWCWQVQNEKLRVKGKEQDACQRWLDAAKLFDNTTPTREECIQVAQVLHGHTWVNEIKVTHTSLLRQTEACSHEPLRDTLVKLLTF